MRISLVQAGFEGAGEENLERAVSLAEAAEGELVVLPELWNLSTFAELERDALEREEVVEGFRDASRDRFVLAGSFAERTGDGFFNTSLLLRDGEVEAAYRKMHLFFEGEEADLMEPGDRVVTADLGGTTAGLSVCYDVRFPELYRRQVERGAELLLLPSAWPLRRVEHWDLLTRTRAVENQCFVVACNRTGFVDDMEMGGHSRVVGPWGTVEAGAAESERVVEAEVDLGEVARTREDFPALRDRREL